MTKERYCVKINRPQGVSVSEMRAYIKHAIDHWSGGFHPSDPLFGHEECTVMRMFDPDNAPHK